MCGYLRRMRCNSVITKWEQLKLDSDSYLCKKLAWILTSKNVLNISIRIGHSWKKTTKPLEHQLFFITIWLAARWNSDWMVWCGLPSQPIWIYFGLYFCSEYLYVVMLLIKNCNRILLFIETKNVDQKFIFYLKQHKLTKQTKSSVVFKAVNHPY